jgi:hypothetical protein
MMQRNLLTVFVTGVVCCLCIVSACSTPKRPTFSCISSVPGFILFPYPLIEQISDGADPNCEIVHDRERDRLVFRDKNASAPPPNAPVIQIPRSSEIVLEEYVSPESWRRNVEKRNQVIADCMRREGNKGTHKGMDRTRESCDISVGFGSEQEATPGFHYGAEFGLSFPRYFVAPVVCDGAVAKLRAVITPYQ